MPPDYLEKKFYVVFRFDLQIEDYVIEGIYTLENDAKILRLDLKDKNQNCSCPMIHMSVNAIREFLAKNPKGNKQQAIDYLEQIQRDFAAMDSGLPTANFGNAS